MLKEVNSSGDNIDDVIDKQELKTVLDEAVTVSLTEFGLLIIKNEGVILFVSVIHGVVLILMSS